MSNQPSSTGGPSGGNAPIPPPQQSSGAAPPVNGMSSQNLNQIVLEYLNKKGYTRTEQTLRQESANLDKDGRPIVPPVEKGNNEKYKRAFDLISAWIEGNLDIYKKELSRILWPLFLYSFIELIELGIQDGAKEYFNMYKGSFELDHETDLKSLALVTLPAHLADNSVAKLYLANKYMLPINEHAYYSLITYLESHDKQGGGVIIHILQEFCKVSETKRGPLDQYSFEALINRARGADTAEEIDMQEGVTGGFTGVTNQDLQNNSTPLKLGPQPMDPDFMADVRAELEDEDRDAPPKLGEPTLVETFQEQRIKREESADALSRLEIPYPAPKARDVAMEVQKMKEYRDRFKIEGRTGGTGPLVSICMFTFHNSMGTIQALEFSDCYTLVAVGTAESYIRVWNLEGKPLKSAMQPRPNDPPPSTSRRLVGHSGGVYSLSFSPSSTNGRPSATPTTPKLLLSSSADGTIRMWSLDTWTCLVTFKGHDGPVWNVRWNPFGHYFASCGLDKTVRLWSQDKISALRLFVGHDSNVDEVAFHPNGAYVFSASDTIDKTVRMWSVTTGNCVRIFTGHADRVSSMECSPDGKILATADCSGSIILWDLAKGVQMKRMKGHGKGGVFSLSWSMESTVLASGGHDGTVRIWDIYLPKDPAKALDGDIIGKTGQADATRIGDKPAAGTSKKKSVEKDITPDQLSAFLTKKTPVLKVKFTRMNLVIAGGCFNP